MHLLGNEEVRAALPWDALIESLRDAFASGATQPLRTVHTVPVPGEAPASFVAMPAWEAGGKLAVKLVFVTPGNTARNLPSVHSTVLVFNAVSGAAEAVMEGAELTARRTAAASALAASLMARKDAKSLLIVGAGAIAENLVPAHCRVRAYDTVTLWARHPDRAARLAERLELPVAIATDLDDAVARADVIATATFARQPLVRGDLLRPGCHLDLVGGYTPDMREADTTAVLRARGGIVVDTFEGAMAEAGDLLQPMREGVLTRSDILCDLAALCRGEATARHRDDQITLFKSVGAAIEDFAAARLVADTTSGLDSSGPARAGHRYSSTGGAASA